MCLWQLRFLCMLYSHDGSTCRENFLNPFLETIVSLCGIQIDAWWCRVRERLQGWVGQWFGAYSFLFVFFHSRSGFGCAATCYYENGNLGGTTSPGVCTPLCCSMLQKVEGRD